MQHIFSGRPPPTGGSYSTPPDLLAGLMGPTSKGRGGQGQEGNICLLFLLATPLDAKTPIFISAVIEPTHTQNLNLCNNCNEM